MTKGACVLINSYQHKERPANTISISAQGADWEKYQKKVRALDGEISWMKEANIAQFADDEIEEKKIQPLSDEYVDFKSEPSFNSNKISETSKF